MSTQATYRLTAITIVVLVAELLAAALMLGIWLGLLKDLPSFRFERPEMLQLLFIGPVLCLIYLLHLSWRNRAIRRFASAGTAPSLFSAVSGTLSTARFLLLRHGLGLVVIALAGPQFGTRLEEVRSEGVDVIVAVDVSNSMVAEDVRPSRMELAQRALSQLIDRMHGDRLGIVVFAGEAFVQLPITTDRSAARLFVPSVNTGSVSLQGTAIGTAIEMAHKSFDLEEPAGRAIIVITDGENHEDDAEGAAKAAAEAGIVVHTVGMGTPQGGPLPIRRNGQIIGFRKDNQGSTVVSRLNEEMLMRIADAGNGTYVRATERNTGVEDLLSELRAMQRTETGTWRFAAHESRFQYPLGAGLILILLALAMSERRSTARRPAFSAVRAASIVSIMVLSGCGDPGLRKADRALRAGNAEYKAARYSEAADHYLGAPHDPRAMHNAGKAFYRARDPQKAVEQFQSAADMMQGGAHAGDAFHDLGNAQVARAFHADSVFKTIASALAAPPGTDQDIATRVREAVLRDSLRQHGNKLMQLSDSSLAMSVEAFKRSLRLSPGDEDTRYNLVLAQRLLAAREKQRRDEKGGDQDKKELSARAKVLMEQADRLVEEHRFKEALHLLQRGLEQEPSLAREKPYIDKLDVVTRAAEAS